MTKNLAGRGEGLAGLRSVDQDYIRDIREWKRSGKVDLAEIEELVLNMAAALEAAAPPSTPDSYTLIQQAIAIHGHIDLTEKGSRPLDCEVCKRIAAALAAALAPPSPQAPPTCIVASCSMPKSCPEFGYCLAERAGVTPAATQEQPAGSGAFLFPLKLHRPGTEWVVELEWVVERPFKLATCGLFASKDEAAARGFYDNAQRILSCWYVDKVWSANGTQR